MLRLHYVPGENGSHNFGHRGRNRVTVTQRRVTGSTNVARRGCRDRRDRFLNGQNICHGSHDGIDLLKCAVVEQGERNKTWRNVTYLNTTWSMSVAGRLVTKRQRKVCQGLSRSIKFCCGLPRCPNPTPQTPCSGSSCGVGLGQRGRPQQNLIDLDRPWQTLRCRLVTSRPATDILQVVLRYVTFRHVLLRSPRSTTAHLSRSIPSWLPWQIFWPFKNLSRRSRQPRRATFVDPVPLRCVTVTQNYLISWTAHFSKGKMLYFPPKFCVFQSTNSTCIHNNIFCVCIIISSWNLCHNIEERSLFKTIPNMKGFVNQLLR